ncbi:MAG: hypothetical protein JW795_12695 [Chitinivibrionales bacterium]|nr:hypothetical protein [Chitinivibrionales bacterium]
MRNILILIFLSMIVCSYAENSTQSVNAISFSWDMNSFSSINYFMLNLIPQMKIGGDQIVMLDLGLGSNWAPDLIDNKLQFLAGLKYKLFNYTLGANYSQIRSQLPFAFSFLSGFTFNAAMDIEGNNIQNQLFYGEVKTPTIRENGVIQDMLTCKGLLYFGVWDIISYNFTLGFARDETNNENAFGVELSMPMNFASKTFFIKPRIGYVWNNHAPGSYLENYFFDFSNISHLQIDYGRISGDFEAAIEAHAKFFPLSGITIPYINDLFLAVFIDAGCYLPKDAMIENAKAAFSISAGPGLNMFDGNSITQFAFGYNSETGWGFLISVSSVL